MTPEENNKKTVLIVEDEPILGKVCARILTAKGYDVNLAENGTSAVRMVEERNYDICLSDIRTPEMNGMEFYRYLKENYPALADNTIFMTGDVMSKDIKLFLEESGARYILKPFTETQLSAAINEQIK